MACMLLERDQVPHPPERVFNGIIDKDGRRWFFEQGLLIRYIRYIPDKQRRHGQLPWAEFWAPDDAR